jgi:hypothetical protein
LAPDEEYKTAVNLIAFKGLFDDLDDAINLTPR